MCGRACITDGVIGVLLLVLDCIVRAVGVVPPTAVGCVGCCDGDVIIITVTIIIVGEGCKVISAGGGGQYISRVLW